MWINTRDGENKTPKKSMIQKCSSSGRGLGTNGSWARGKVRGKQHVWTQERRNVKESETFRSIFGIGNGRPHHSGGAGWGSLRT